MRRLALVILAVAGLLAPATASAQYAIPETTLTAAVAVGDDIVTIGVAAEVGDDIVTPFEVMRVIRLENTAGTRVRVLRGQRGSRNIVHPSDIIAWVDEPRRFFGGNPTGRCGDNQATTPYINANERRIWECVYGLWHEWDFDLVVDVPIVQHQTSDVSRQILREDFDRTLAAYPMSALGLSFVTPIVSDAGENIVLGSAFGPTWYEEIHAKTTATRSWIISNGALNIAENDANDEGMEWTIAAARCGLARLRRLDLTAVFRWLRQHGRPNRGREQGRPARDRVQGMDHQ